MQYSPDLVQVSYILQRDKINHENGKLLESSHDSFVHKACVWYVENSQYNLPSESTRDLL